MSAWTMLWSGSVGLISRVCILVCVLYGALGLARSAYAQSTPGQRRQAARAYDEGRVHYRSGEYDNAAQAFMAAYRLAPSENALIQAVRSYMRAEHLDRAGTLALALAEQYSNSNAAMRTAEEAINAASEHYLRVDVMCGDGSQPCELAVDGRAISSTSFFAEPFRDVEVTIAFGPATVTKHVNGVAGGSAILEVDPSEATAPAGGGATFSPETARFVTQQEQADDPESTQLNQGSSSGDDEQSGGVSRGWFLTGAAITAALAGVTVWSGVNTLSGVDAYEANPTQMGLDEGSRKETRTNVLIGATAGVAALTLVLAIFTDWSGGDSDEEASLSPGGWVDGQGAGLSLGGRL